MRMRVAGTVLVALVATGAVAEEKVGSTSAPAATAQPALAEGEKLSYALGMDLATQFKKQSVLLQPEAFARGMKDALSGGSTALTEQEPRTLITNLQTEMRKKFEAERQAAAEKAKIEGEKSKAAGEAFLATNKAKAGVVTLASGLQYEVLTAGTGKKPTLEDTVDCQYRGTLVDGTEFDSSYARNQPATFPVKGVIKGWTEALQLMPVGSKWRIVIPSQLAYGERGAGPIPPNSTLVFELELLSIK
jgi:FKBP-type peptidyl-prolyl cis-trans isomerase